MFNFFALAQSVQLIDLEKIHNDLREEYKDLYEIYKLAISDDDNLVLYLKFTDYYWRDWRSNYSDFYSFGKHLTFLGQDHFLIINKNGLILVRSDSKNEMAEAREHYKFLCDRIIQTLIDTNYVVAQVKNAAQYQSFLYHFGFDITLEDFVKKIQTIMNERVTQFTALFDRLIGSIITETENLRTPLGFAQIQTEKEYAQSRNRYEDGKIKTGWHTSITNLHDTFLEILVSVRIMKHTVKRMAIHSSSDWGVISEQLSSTEDVLAGSSEQIDRILKSYSDYMNSFAIQATLVGIGIGMFIPTITMTELVYQIPLWIIGTSMIIAPPYFGRKANIKNAIIHKLKKMKSMLNYSSED